MCILYKRQHAQALNLSYFSRILTNEECRANPVPSSNNQILYCYVLIKSCSYFTGCSSKEIRISGLTIKHLTCFSDINISPVWRNKFEIFSWKCSRTMEMGDTIKLNNSIFSNLKNNIYILLNNYCSMSDTGSLQHNLHINNWQLTKSTVMSMFKPTILCLPRLHSSNVYY